MLRIFPFLLLFPAAAFAQTTESALAASGVGSPVTSLLPLLLIFFVFYFLLIKPQQKRMKEHQTMLANLKKDDEIITGGGIIGRIIRVDDGDRFTVEIAKGVEVMVQKSTVSGLVAAGKSAVVAGKKKSGGNRNDNVVPSRDNVANDN